MKKVFSFLLVLVAFVGCKKSAGLGVTVPKERQTPYGLVRLDDSLSYLIDPRTETCLLIFQDYSVDAGDGITATPVDCAKLKKNSVDAAQFITWIQDPPKTP